MSDRFFDRPILNSPYEYPSQHWELDESGQPTSSVLDRRRRVSFITPIPKPKKRGQRTLVFDEAAQALEAEGQQYELMELINKLRRRVDAWRSIPHSGRWRVTPETARLLKHWRSHRFGDIRPFFCQVEAAETAIWLTEVAPRLGNEGRRFLDHLAAANEQANPGLARLALKLATGAGKTTVMAMLIAWQTVNAVRRPGSRRFTRGFLVVTPGLTIRDRLRVLQPNDPDSYYRSRELVPADMLGDLDRAKIVITNYDALMRREILAISKGGRALLQGRGKGNLFVIFGEPDIDVLPAEGDGGDGEQFQVRINGVDVFHPNSGEIRSDGADGIACWFIDTDYNEESFFVRHAYFFGAGDSYKALKTTLKAEINEEAWLTLRSDTSRPFDRPSSGRIAVKVINHLGDEVMKVYRV